MESSQHSGSFLTTAVLCQGGLQRAARHRVQPEFRAFAQRGVIRAASHTPLHGPMAYTPVGRVRRDRCRLKLQLCTTLVQLYSTDAYSCTCSCIGACTTSNTIDVQYAVHDPWRRLCPAIEASLVLWCLWLCSSMTHMSLQTSILIRLTSV